MTTIPPAPASPPTGARARAREAAIVDAALELLLEVGYDRLTMDAVAERARAGKATIYRHFPDKAALVLHAIGEEASADEVPPDTGSLRGDLLEFGRAASKAATTDGGLFAALLNASRTDEALAARISERVSQSKQRAIRTIVERAVERGELADASRVPLVCEASSAIVLHRFAIEREPLDATFFEHLIDEIAIPLLTYVPPPVMSSAGGKRPPARRPTASSPHRVSKGEP